MERNKAAEGSLIWSAIIVVYGVIFCYLPLGGWLMAFQNYKPKDGLLHSSLWDLQNSSSYFPMQPFAGNQKYTCHGCDQSGRHLCDGDRICNFIERGKITGGKRSYRPFLICRISFPGLLLPVFYMMHYRAPVLSTNF